MIHFVVKPDPEYKAVPYESKPVFARLINSEKNKKMYVINT